MITNPKAQQSSINLVPQEIEKQRRVLVRQNSIRIFTYLQFVIVLFVCIILWGIRIYYSQGVSAANSAFKQQAEIIKAQDLTINTVNRIQRKSAAFQDVLPVQKSFSALLSVFPTILPQSTQVMSLTVNNKEVVFKGSTIGSVEVAKILEVAKDSERGGRIFSGAELSTLSINPITNQVEFNIILTLITDKADPAKDPAIKIPVETEL